MKTAQNSPRKIIFAWSYRLLCFRNF